MTSVTWTTEEHCDPYTLSLRLPCTLNDDDPAWLPILGLVDVLIPLLPKNLLSTILSAMIFHKRPI